MRNQKKDLKKKAAAYNSDGAKNTARSSAIIPPPSTCATDEQLMFEAGRQSVPMSAFHSDHVA